MPSRMDRCSSRDPSRVWKMRRKWWLSAGQVLDRDLRHQVQVELRSDPGQGPGQDLGAFVRPVFHQVVGSEQAHELADRGGVMAGPVSESGADHAGLQLEVQPGGHHRVVEARHHDYFVGELVVRSAPAAEFLAQRALLLLGHVLDDQHLEVGPVGPGRVSRAAVGLVEVVVELGVPDLPVVGIAGQGPVEPGHDRRAPVVLPGCEQPPDLLVGRHAGKGPEPLDGPEEFELRGHRLGQRLEGTLLAAGQRQLACCLFQPGPGVVPDLPQAVVRVRAFRHGNHLRDVRPRSGPARPGDRLKVTIYPQAGAPQGIWPSSRTAFRPRRRRRRSARPGLSSAGPRRPGRTARSSAARTGCSRFCCCPTGWWRCG